MNLVDFQWHDEETGLNRPSLVYLDVSNLPNEGLFIDFDEVLEKAPVLKIKPIQDFEEPFAGGLLNHRKVRLSGYRFLWHHLEKSPKRYAVFVAFERCRPERQQLPKGE